MLSKTPEIVHTVSKDIIYFPILFRGNKSYKVRNDLKKLISTHFPQVDLRIVFKPIRSLKDFFKVKDVVPCNLKANFVYKYHCNICEDSYIGKTTKHYHFRKCQHLGISDRTGKVLKTKVFSSIRDHCEFEGHPMLEENFSIMKAFKPKYLEMGESLITSKLKPKIGNNESSCKLNIVA